MVLASTRQRIAAALLGNGFVRVVRISEQIFLIPILLAAWGAVQFGEWMALTSVASFAYLANLGIGQAALSDIVMRYSSGDREGASRSFVTAVMLITVAIAIGFAVLLSAVPWLGSGGALLPQSMALHDARLVILIFGFALLVNFYTEPLTGAISAEIGLAVPNVLAAFSKVLEIVGIAIAIRFSATPVAVAWIILCASVGNVLLLSIAARRWGGWISFNVRQFRIDALQRTWKASLGYFVIVVCMTFVYLQVPRLIVFHYFGAAALAGFTVFVTYTRVGRMLASMVAQAAQVEMSRAFGGGQLDRFRTWCKAWSARRSALAASPRQRLLRLRQSSFRSGRGARFWWIGRCSRPWRWLRSSARFSMRL